MLHNKNLLVPACPNFESRNDVNIKMLDQDEDQEEGGAAACSREEPNFPN